MGGESKQTTQTNATSSSRPWEASQPLIQGLIGKLNGLNISPSAGTTAAANNVVDAASRVPDFSGDATKLTQDLFSGGPDYSGMLSSSFGDLTRRLSPIADGTNLDPSSNPAINGWLTTVGDDIQNRISSQFAAAGRDFSPAEARSVARGVSEGTAPILANQYNTNVSNMMDAAKTLFTGGGTTAEGLTSFAQNALGNRSKAIDLSAMLPQLFTSQSQGVLDAEKARDALPLESLARFEQLALPLAQLGTDTESASNSVTSKKEDPTRAIIGGVIGGLGLLGGNPMSLLGSGAGGLTSLLGKFGASNGGWNAADQMINSRLFPGYGTG